MCTGALLVLDILQEYRIAKANGKLLKVFNKKLLFHKEYNFKRLIQFYSYKQIF